MKSYTSSTLREPQKIKQLSHAELVLMVLELQKIIAMMKRFEQTADLLSVIQSCRFQARYIIAFFCEAISAHSCDLASPSLIPLN